MGIDWKAVFLSHVQRAPDGVMEVDFPRAYAAAVLAGWIPAVQMPYDEAVRLLLRWAKDHTGANNFRIRGPKMQLEELVEPPSGPVATGGASTARPEVVIG